MPVGGCEREAAINVPWDTWCPPTGTGGQASDCVGAGYLALAAQKLHSRGMKITDMIQKRMLS
ncbi:MAG: hypothetical protein WBQ30_13155, partial [Thermoanaerobaculia bacterium]